MFSEKVVNSRVLGRLPGLLTDCVGKYRPLYSPTFSLQSRHGRAGIELIGQTGAVDGTPAVHA